ncbi:MAG: ABC transporter ATP-binding protein [Bifidobacteriaceae bacterium]|nr:ABC transporter ATP-binding protein [Bifidobacteriaceae bacterium]
MIEVEDLTKVFGATRAVDGVSFAVEPGAVTGFLGPNGAGKSTVIKMLLGLVHPTAGTGTVLGRPLGDVQARRRVGYLPELFRFQDWMSGADLLAFHARLGGLRPDPERAAALLARVGLTGRGKDKVGGYSKGMQQRLGLALALVGNPELLLLDEPTSALDPIGRKDVRELIRELAAEGVTVFLNSHLLSEVEAVSDAVTIIDKGRIVASGTMDALLGRSLTVTVRADGLSEDDAARLRRRFDPAARSGPAGTLTLAVDDDAVLPEIARTVVESGARLFELTSRRETLEHLFLHAVAEEADAEEADAGTGAAR